MVDISAHPTLEQLLAFDRGLLPPEDWPEIDRHIVDCESCCQKLGELPDDYMVAVLRSPPALSDIALPAAAVHDGEQPSIAAGDYGERIAELPRELENHPRYRVLALLGAGGMGTVYQAEHKLMGRVVALKVIQNRLLGKPDWIERFRREIRAAAHLNHPNIVHAYDAEQLGDSQVLVMEYVAGETLEQIVEREGPLPVAESCEYARQAALGLDHAYARGMVHRDIKPQNLLRTPDGQIKILDFGLARFISENVAAPPLTQSGLTMGTPDYLAPEQALDPRRADIRADIYSLGCTLYFLLTGMPPYPEGTPLQKVLSHQDQAPVPLAERRSQVPAQLRRTIEKMMAKDTAARYQTPQEVVAALAPWTGREPQVAASAVEHPPRRRAWPIVALVGGFLFCLCWAVAATAWKGSRAAPVGPSATVLVVTRIPAASASVVEKCVTDPVERAVSRAAGAARVESRSLRGLSVVKIHFRDDVSQGLAVAATDSLVRQITPELAKASSPLVMPINFDARAPLGFVALKSSHLDAAQLTEFAMTELRTALGSLPGLGPLTVAGGSKRVMLISFDRAKLQARQRSMLAVADALKDETEDVLSGTVTYGESEQGESEYEIRAERRTGQQLVNIPLPDSRAGHATDYIRDVATIEETLASGDSLVRVNGAPSVVVPTYALAGANVANLRAAVEKAMADVEQRLPESSELKFLAFPTGDDLGLFRLQIRLASDSSLEKTKSLVAELEGAIRGQIADDNIAFLLSLVGVEDDWSSAFRGNSSLSEATLFVRLTAPASRDVDRQASMLRDILRKDQRFARFEIIVTTPNSSEIEVQLVGPDLNRGRELAEQVRRRIVEAKLSQAQIVERLDAPGYELAIDARKAADLGITAAEIRLQVALATGGQGSSWLDAASGARLQIAAPFIRSVTDLQNLPIGGARQKLPVRLGDVAQIQKTVAPVEIDHTGLQRVTRVRAYVEEGEREAAIKKLREIIADLPSSPGMRIELAE